MLTILVGIFLFHLVNFDVQMLISESLSSDGHLPRSSKLEDKDRELKREMDGAKEKERYKEKYMGKSIQELDLSDCKRCTPSYRLLPADVYNFKLILLSALSNMLFLWNSFTPFVLSLFSFFAVSNSYG